MRSTPRGLGPAAIPIVLCAVAGTAGAGSLEGARGSRIEAELAGAESNRHAAPGATRAAVTGALAGESPGPPRRGQRFEVLVGEGALRRDAMSTAAVVGRVMRGDEVTFVDFIDRRLRVLNVLLFDGGHWIKVRAANGAIGWVPASVLRRLP